MGTPGYLFGRALARFFDAIFGLLLLIGPFVLFLYRGFSLALVITFLLLAAGYGYVVWRYRESGLAYLRELASDTLTAMAATIGAAGASMILASFTRVHLHAHALFVPSAVIGFFWFLEYRAARHRGERPRRAAWLGRAEEVVEIKKRAKQTPLPLNPPWSAPAELPARSSKP